MFPDAERFRWFEAHAQGIVEKCRREAKCVPGFSERPLPVYVPGGDDKYPSFWIRDFVMQCRGGTIDRDLMESLLRLILHHQNGPRRRDLANGLRVDPWAVADHINLPGVGNESFQRTYASGAVFYPGTYSPSDHQGDGRFGCRPADDDIYEVIELAALITRAMDRPRAAALLKSRIQDVPIVDRLFNGFKAMTVHPETGLCWNRPDDWAASNFHDALKPMGMIALTSCLRFRAAHALRELGGIVGDRLMGAACAETADRIARSLVAHLQAPSGWLMTGTEADRQPDVWSTSMAVYYDILQGEPRRAACEAMRRAYREGDVARFGYLRHTPLSGDAVPGEQAWEDGLSANYGVYQNGGYWPQPLGYYAFALAQVDVGDARRMACEFIDHTRARADAGAPFEWINPDLSPPREDGKWYGPSAALPLEGLRRLGGS